MVVWVLGIFYCKFPTLVGQGSTITYEIWYQSKSEPRDAYASVNIPSRCADAAGTKRQIFIASSAVPVQRLMDVIYSLCT